MNVTCPKCHTIYRVDPRKVPLHGVRARCSECPSEFVVEQEASVDGRSGAQPAAAATMALAEPVAAHDEQAELYEDERVSSVEVSAEPRPELVAPDVVLTSYEEDVSLAEQEEAAITSASLQAELSTYDAYEEPGAGEESSEVHPLPTLEGYAERGQAEVATLEPSIGVEAHADSKKTGDRNEFAAAGATASERVAAATAALVEQAAPTQEGYAVRPRSDEDIGLAPSPFATPDPHARARRLARALVSDMVAYNSEKRNRSLQQGTIRQEFRDEIRKSWEEYVAQVGNQFARDTTYFRDALNELLAGGSHLF